jgi:hypothetical protein
MGRRVLGQLLGMSESRLITRRKRFLGSLGGQKGPVFGGANDRPASGEVSDVRLWHLADIGPSPGNVRFWHKADIGLSPGNVRFWG